MLCLYSFLTTRVLAQLLWPIWARQSPDWLCESRKAFRLIKQPNTKVSFAITAFVPGILHWNALQGGSASNVAHHGLFFICHTLS
jgi:hypothetical protein